MTKTTRFGPPIIRLRTGHLGYDVDSPTGPSTGSNVAIPSNFLNDEDARAWYPVSGSGSTTLVQSKVVTPSGSSPASFEVSFDSPVTGGNLLVVLLAARSFTGTMNEPPGWTYADDINVNGSNGGDGGLFYKIADGTEGVGPFNFTSAAAQRRYTMAEFSGPNQFVDSAHVDNNAATTSLVLGEVTPTNGEPSLLIAAGVNSKAITSVGTGYTTVSTGLVEGGINGPGSILAYKAVDPASGNYNATVTQTISDSVCGGAHLAFSGIGDPIWVPAPYVVDANDATYHQITGHTECLRVQLTDDFRVGRARLVIGTQTSGAKSYSLEGQTLADIGAGTGTEIGSFDFTATGSYTADEIEINISGADGYEFYRLVGPSENRRIYTLELYPPTTASSGVTDHGALTGLSDDDHPQYIEFDDLGWFNVMDYGATGDGVTDDTDAIQDAIAAAVALEGGTIYFPPGIYVIDGALQDTGAFNGQLLLPNVDHSDPHITLTFRGALRPGLHPVYGSDPPPDGVATLRTTLTGGTGTAAVFSGGNNLDAPHLGGGNNLSVNVEDLWCEAPPDPSLTFWNLSACQGGSFKDVLLSITGTGVEPTNSHAYGVKLPQVYFSNYTRTEGLSIAGYYTCLLNGELAMHHGLIGGVCIVFVEQPEMFYPSVIFDMTVTSFQYGIRFTGGDSRLDILSYTAEHSTDPPFDAWMVTIADVDDPNDYGYGYHRWFCAETGGAPDHTFTVNGGANLGNQEVGAEWGTSSGSDTLRWEAVTDGEDVFVWEGDDLVHEFKEYP